MAIVLGISFLAFSGYTATASAQPAIETKGLAQQQYLVSAEGDQLGLTSSQAVTIYLPIVITPPPPNPKKGIGVRNPPACADLSTLRGSWYLNWAPFPDTTCEGVDERFVPRIPDANSMQWLTQAISNAQASGWLIGFSEPNLPWQANMSPAEGAILWKQIEDAATPAGIKLVSPSPNQWEPGQADPYGHQWTWAMVDMYKAMYGQNPHFDALGWNIYKSNPEATKTFLIARHNEALTRGYNNVPIWVLEYGGECWNSTNGNTGNQSIMTTITAWFDATPWIGRYAWFANRLSGSDPEAIGWQSCSLIDPNTGVLTSLGQIYTTY